LKSFEETLYPTDQ